MIPARLNINRSDFATRIQMTHSQNTTRIRIAIITVAALMLVMAATPHAQAAAPITQTASVSNCNLSGATTPCFELVWVEGHQFKMTFIDLNPQPHSPSDVNFYVLAPQTSHPQGGPVPFFHDHVTAETQPQKASHGDFNLNYHGFFVFCTAQGISSGACVPTMTSFPGDGTVPFATTVNGHSLTSSDGIESAANSGLVTLVDTGAVFIASLHPGA